MSFKQALNDDDFQPISALNDLLFCERRCAMHRIEGVWTDNVHTLEGTHGHQRADKLMVESGSGVRVVHAILLKSERLRLTGKADVVEFQRFVVPPLGGETDSAETHAPRGQSGPAKAGTTNLPETPYPVEYKRGRRRRWDNDDVQLCAQAMCLEEMLGVAVPAGAIFHVKSKRRREIMFTPELRAKTEEAARRLHELVASGVTPPPVLKPRCRGCSLRELCMPELLSQRANVTRYLVGLFSSEAVPP